MVGKAVEMIVASVEERMDVTLSATKSIQNLKLCGNQYTFCGKEKNKRISRGC